MKVYDMVTRMDALGSPMSLRIGGRSTHQTMYGAVLTLLSLGLTVWSSVGYFYEFYDQTKPSLIVSNREAYNFPKIDMSADGIVPSFFFLYNGEFIPPAEVQRYVSIKVFSYVRNTEDQVQPAKLTELNAVVPCGLMSKDKLNRLYSYSAVDDNAYKQIFSSSGICIDPPPEMHHVQGRLSDNYRRTFQIRVGPCERTDCINFYRSGFLSIVFSNPSFSFEPTDYENPVQSIPKFNPIFTINPKSSTIYEFLLKTNLVYDSTGIFRKEELRRNYSSIHEEFSVDSARDESILSCVPGSYCDPFFIIEYQATGSSVRTVRVYKSLLETFASIGGVNKVISMVIGVAYAVLHYFTSKNLLVKGIFNLSNESKSIASYLQSARTGLVVKDPKLLRKVKQQLSSCAESIIDHHLDVFTLVKEISRMRLITDMILSPCQLKVEPFISLSQEMKKRRGNQKVDDPKQKCSAPSSPFGKQKYLC